MKRKPIVLALVIMLVIGRPAFGRIGETEAQIVARYGESLPANAKTMLGQPLKVFLTADLRVGVAFIDGKSAAELFSKIDGTEIPDSEIQVILQSNTAGSHWATSRDGPFGLRGWSLQSGGRIAGYTKKSLTICTQEFLAISAADTAREAKEKLKGF
jgi:hypothetical protein